MAETLRIAFMGTPDFAVPTLRALLDAGHEVVCVYTQPPSRSGRGHKTQPSPVQKEAEKHGIEVRTPGSLKDDATQRGFAALQLDASVVAAYGLILPAPVLTAPRLGCLNVHASLLPRWRGAAPIQRAILAGDAETGVTIMQMAEGLDTGAVVLTQPVEIDSDTDAGGLHDTLANLGGRMIAWALDGLAKGELTPAAQAETGVTYADKLRAEDRKLDWSRPAIELERLVRAFAPKPGATTRLPDGETLKVLRAEVGPAAASGTRPGTVLDATIFAVACGLGSLKLLQVQRGGRKPMDAATFLRGYTLERDQVLD